MKKSGMVFVVIVAVFAIAIVLIASYVIMLLANVILGQYGVELLEYSSALAVVMLLVVARVIGAVGGSSS